MRKRRSLVSGPFRVLVGVRVWVRHMSLVDVAGGVAACCIVDPSGRFFHAKSVHTDDSVIGAVGVFTLPDLSRYVRVS